MKYEAWGSPETNIATLLVGDGLTLEQLNPLLDEGDVLLRTFEVVNYWHAKMLHHQANGWEVPIPADDAWDDEKIEFLLTCDALTMNGDMHNIEASQEKMYALYDEAHCKPRIWLYSPLVLTRNPALMQQWETTKKLEARRYQCERCGGFGKQEAGLYNINTKYDAPAGVCESCNGEGYLGFI